MSSCACFLPRGNVTSMWSEVLPGAHSLVHQRQCCIGHSSALNVIWKILKDLETQSHKMLENITSRSYRTIVKILEVFLLTSFSEFFFEKIWRNRSLWRVPQASEALSVSLWDRPGDEQLDGNLHLHWKLCRGSGTIQIHKITQKNHEEFSMIQNMKFWKIWTLFMKIIEIWT